MEAIYFFAALVFAIGGMFLFLALWGRDPKHLGTAVGKLDQSKKVMRQAYRHSSKKIPVTTARYLYEVNGKTYRLRREGRFGRSTLLPRITVVYLKGLPRFGYLEKYPCGLFAMGAGVCILYGVLFLFLPYI